VASSGSIVGPGPRSCTHLPGTPDEPSGILAANDESAARTAAQTALAVRIKDDYPGFRVVPKSLVVRVEPAPSGRGDDSVTLRLHLTCLRPLIERENVLTVFNWQIASRDKVVADTFQVRIVATVDGEEAVRQGQLKSIGRGAAPTETSAPFLVWRGEVLDDPVELNLKIVSSAAGRTLNTGSVTVKLRNHDGLLAVEWLPGATSRILRDDTTGPCASTLWRFDGESVPFSASITVSRASELAEYYRKKGQELREEARAFEKNLQSAEPGVLVMNGFVHADAIDQTGRKSQLLSGGVFVISADAAKGQAFVDKTFPNRKDVHLVKDQAEALAFLDQQWANAKKTIFRKEKILEGTEKTIFTPKTGYTVQEQILKQVSRPR
jgi:hypothetical protein